MKPQHQLLPTSALIEWWSNAILRHTRLLLATPLLVCALLLPLALNATSHSVPDGWLPDTTEAVQVQKIAQQQFGRNDSTYYVLFSDPESGMLADDPDFVLEVQRIVRPLRVEPGIDNVYTWGTTKSDLLNTILISDDRANSLAVVTLNESKESKSLDSSWLRSTMEHSHLSVQITGLPAVGDDFRTVGHNDLVRAELISLPITFVLLIMVFRGWIPALMPVALAVCSMSATLAVMTVLSRFAVVNVFTVNVVTMLGLAVSIDYALIMLSRFSEELPNHDLRTAITITLATAGRAVVIAGTTVSIGLCGLLFFDVQAATTTAILGALVVIVAVGLSLTALPAAMILLANNLKRVENQERAPMWLDTVERQRQKHPVITIVLCLTLLTAMTAPIAHLRGVSPGIANLPSSAESRVTADAIQQDFPLAGTSPIEIVITPARGSMLEDFNLAAYLDTVEIVGRIDGVQRVESLWSAMPIKLSPATLSASYVLEPDLVAASRPFLSPHAALITVVPDPGPGYEGQTNLVNRIRAQFQNQPVPGVRISVGGAISLDIDLLTYVKSKIPMVLTVVLVLTALALFVQLRSIVLPIKAIILNIASIGASFGALVWIFQDGHFSNVLRFEHQGTTVLLVPVLMFCFLFGLSMDFEVIILSRIREAWIETGDNMLAVNRGITQSAGIVTSSAILMLTVFLAFAFSELDVVKAIGIGLAIAVLIDATVVRLLLLPATMQLMGRWNWWPGKR